MTPDERPVRNLNDLVNDALLRWMDLIGLDLDGNITDRSTTPWSRWDLQKYTEALSEARSLDPSGLTTFMMLRGLTENFLQDVQFSAYDLILEPKAIAAKLVPMRALRDVLEDSQVVELIADFQKKVRDAALHYGVTGEEANAKLDELLKDKFHLALVRRDALLSINKLEAHQFTQGPKDPNSLKYNPTVFEFWNINSLLLAMRAQRVAGISLNLIRDPEEALHSYFVFAIRNGGTLTILTDRDKEPHPAYRRMSRRPDRALSERSSRHWFPYQLLDLREAKDELGNTKRLYANARTQLVPVNVEAVALKPIRELEAEQFVWTTLMFDLIHDKFWKQDEKLPELSYTGQMVVEPAALVGAAGTLVKEGLYKPLELPKITKSDVTAEATAPQWEREVSGFNRWMVERYGPKVPDELLNPVGDQAALLLAEKAQDPQFLPVVKDAWGKIETFETLNPMTFGSKEKIQKDRVWVARVNQMKAIQRLADEEFAREKENILAWFEAAIRLRKQELVDAACRGELFLPDVRFHHFGDDEVDPNTSETKEVNALKQGFGDKWHKAFGDEYYFLRPRIDFGPQNIVTDRTMCCVRGDLNANVFTVVRPTCPEGIAKLCGLTVEKLPWALQHWYKDEPYTGNSILDRLDPEDWILSNPWVPSNRKPGIALSVGVPLSKTAYHARRKELGLPRKKWETKDEDE